MTRAAFGLCAIFIASASVARAQDAPPDGSGTQGADSAKGNAREQGSSAAPPGLAPGTYDTGRGLSFLFNYTGEAATNPAGGLKPGGYDFAGQVFIGADADLNKIAGLAGGSLHGIFTERHGGNLQAHNLGNDTSVQEIYGGGQTYRLTQLSYEQRLFNDHLDAEVGRLNGQGAFLVSPIYCNFQNNATCGSPTTAFKITNFTYFPTSTWAGHARIWLDPDYRYFFHIGVYEVNPLTQLASDHGVDWSTRGSTGVVIPMELGYSTTLATDRLPRNYGIGAIVDRSKYSDPTLDTSGGQAFFTGGSPLQQFGRTAVYARFDQMVWRPDPTGPQGLTLFGLAMFGTSGRQTQDYFLEGGAVLTGTLANRPYDTLGFVTSVQKYSGLGLQNVQYAFGPLGYPVYSNQVMMELNYGIQVNPALRITPQLQYIINPINTVPPPRPIPNAFVIGCKLSADIFTLAGVAKGPGSQ